MYEKIIEYINKYEGVCWVIFNEIVDDFLK